LTGRSFGAVIFALILGLNWGSGQEFSILFTGSLNGVIENCNCPDKPLGGVDKRAQFIAVYREDHPEVLVIDNGDNTVDFLAEGVEKVIVAAFDIIDYDVINLGDQDMAYAPAAYLELGPVIEEHGAALTVEKGGVLFSVLPLLHQRATRFYPDFVFAGVDLDHPESRIEAWLEDAPEAAFKILLSHSGYDADRAFAGAYPGIDLIVGGHSQTVLDTLVEVNGVPIVQAGGNGGYIGEVRFEAQGHDYSLVYHQLHPLTYSMPGSQDVIDLIGKYVPGHESK